MKSVYEHPYASFEGNFQMTATHVGVAVVNNVLRVGDGDVSIKIIGDIFRKTSTSGSDVGMLIEVWELSAPSTGGAVYDNVFSVNKDREKGGEGVGYTTRQLVTVANLTGANIMMRERGTASKPEIDRSDDINLTYNLKKNTDYLFRSSVVSGVLNDSQSTIFGTIWVA